MSKNDVGVIRMSDPCIACTCVHVSGRVFSMRVMCGCGYCGEYLPPFFVLMLVICMF